MPTLPQTVAALLREVRRPGSFYATGTVDLTLPRLAVEGVGAVALPLLPMQAEQLAAVAEQAPYGRGTETLVDTAVRRTWQIGAERVRIGGKGWEQALAAMTEQAAGALGVEGPVEAELYKLLVYETGGFFVGHRDTEKAPGMFATLVVVLPSDYRGGELLVRHQGEEVRLDLHRDDPAEVAFAAFYADCRHEVLPIASGHRLTLIYNLIRPRRAKGALPTAPDYGEVPERLAARLRAWGGGGAGPAKLVYPLEHAYTEAELGFDALKGADAAVAKVVAAAARQAECEAFLALLRIEESGIAEYTGYYGRRGRYRDDEDEGFEIGEVTDRSETLSHWCRPDGSRPPLRPLPFGEEEIAPPGALDSLEPTELEFSEATGNAGASFDRLYQRAVLVVWPRARRVEVFAQAGLAAAIPLLGELIGEWRAAGGEPQSPLCAEALQLAAAIGRDWPEEGWQRRGVSQRGEGAAYLRYLDALGDAAAIDAFLDQRVAAGAYGEQENEPLVTVLRHLPAARAGALLARILDRNGKERPNGCAALLARATAGGGDPAWLRAAASALVETVCVEPPPPARSDFIRPAEQASPAMVADLVTALERVEPALAERAARWFLDHPDRYPVDPLLLPAVRLLRERAAVGEGAGMLLGAVLDHLRRRIAETLAPPEDWRRAAPLACNCAACRQVARFLDDPAQPVLRYPAAEAVRRHLEERIKASRCDLDCTTDKKGRPYTLVCTKNQASYERRVRQRQGDLEDLERLEGERER